jgi:hypothetical protein
VAGLGLSAGVPVSLLNVVTSREHVSSLRPTRGEEMHSQDCLPIHS